MCQVGDLAMKALRGAEAASHEDEEGDGSWLLGLLKVRELEPCLCCILIPCQLQQQVPVIFHATGVALEAWRLNGFVFF
jgi:hypothetical protein